MPARVEFIGFDPSLGILPRDPNVNDDSTKGHGIGSRWVNTASSPRRHFVCVDATEGAAIWLVSAPSFAYAKTRLIVTGNIAAGTTLSTTASGANYTHNGDATSLGASQAIFRATHSMRIDVNGVEQDKETEILWVTATSFQLISLSLDPGDIITIYN